VRCHRALSLLRVRDVQCDYKFQVEPLLAVQIRLHQGGKVGQSAVNDKSVVVVPCVTVKLVMSPTRFWPV